MTWWMALIVAIPLWVFVAGVLWIFWSWREIPDLLRALDTPSEDHEEVETSPFPDDARWYETPEPPGDPTQKNVHWPEDISNS